MRFSEVAQSISKATLKWLTPHWMLCATLVLILSQLIILTWHLWLPSEMSNADLTRQALSQISTASRDAAASPDFTLFGTAAPVSETTDAVSADVSLYNAPPSALNIQLTGIVASPTPGKSIAIIAKDSKQFSLTVGDSTPGATAKIAAIFTDRVVISYQGRYESLFLSNAPTARAGNENDTEALKQ
jgi:general secretion pathway protein C